MYGFPDEYTKGINFQNMSEHMLNLSLNKAKPVIADPKIEIDEASYLTHDIKFLDITNESSKIEKYAKQVASIAEEAELGAMPNYYYSGSHKFLAVDQKDNVIAFVIGKIQNKTPKDLEKSKQINQPHFYIDDVAVHSKYRKRGIGKEMLREAMRRIREELKLRYVALDYIVKEDSLGYAKSFVWRKIFYDDFTKKFGLKSEEKDYTHKFEEDGSYKYVSKVSKVFDLATGNLEKVAFKRKAYHDLPINDLKLFEGVFGENPFQLKISSQQDKLVMVYLGGSQKGMELVRETNLKFILKGLSDYGIQFILDDEDKVSAIEFFQPDSSSIYKKQS